MGERRQRRTGSVAAPLVAFVLALPVTALPAPAAVAETPTRAVAAPDRPKSAVAAWAAEGADRFMRWAARAGAPKELFDGLQKLDPVEDHFITNLAWPDLTGDGFDDVLAVDFNFGAAGLGLEGTSTTLTAFGGRTGKILWAEEFEREMSFPVAVRLGAKARTGVLIVTLDWANDTTRFVALDHRGRRAYRHEFTASSTFDRGQLTGREDVVSFGVLNALPGRASDVLIGIASVREVPPVHPGAPTIAGYTKTVVIDGKSGGLVSHADPELGVGRVPVPLAGPDLDADGLEDQVVTYVLPDLPADEETGLPGLPSASGQYVRGRRGSDGAKLWTSEALDLADDWESPPLLVQTDLGRVTRDRSHEVVLHYDPFGFVGTSFRWFSPHPDPKGTWVIDGKNGTVLWWRDVTSPLVSRDVDGDGRRDVVATVDVNTRKRSGTRLLALSSLDGKDVYARFFPQRRGKDERVESFLWRAGDLQPDGVGDYLLQQSLRRDSPNSTRWRMMPPRFVSGRTGAQLGRRSWHTFPMWASLDGRGDDLFAYAHGPPNVARIADGRTRELLLVTALDIPMTLPTDHDLLSVDAGHLDGDGCADLVGTLVSSKDTFVVALDGGSGKLTWSKRQLGLDVGGPIVQTRRHDANSAC